MNSCCTRTGQGPGPRDPRSHSEKSSSQPVRVPANARRWIFLLLCLRRPFPLIKVSPRQLAGGARRKGRGRRADPRLEARGRRPWPRPRPRRGGPPSPAKPPRACFSSSPPSRKFAFPRTADATVAIKQRGRCSISDITKTSYSPCLNLRARCCRCTAGFLPDEAGSRSGGNIVRPPQTPGTARASLAWSGRLPLRTTAPHNEPGRRGGTRPAIPRPAAPAVPWALPASAARGRHGRGLRVVGQNLSAAADRRTGPGSPGVCLAVHGHGHSGDRQHNPADGGPIGGGPVRRPAPVVTSNENQGVLRQRHGRPATNFPPPPAGPTASISR